MHKTKKTTEHVHKLTRKNIVTTKIINTTYHQNITRSSKTKEKHKFYKLRLYSIHIRNYTTINGQ